jgi:cell division protein FtsQ
MALGRLIPSARSLLIGFALVAIAAGAYVAARTTGMFAVREIEVRGAPAQVAREVRSALDPIVGQSLVTLDGGDVVRRLEAVPDVESATYDRSFPNTLVVTISPEQPAAVVRQGADAWLVSVRGRVLRPLPRTARSELPRIWAAKDVELTRGSTVDDDAVLRAVTAVAPLATDPFPVRILAVRLHEDSLTLRLSSGLELLLGDSNDLRLKLAVARRIVPTLTPPDQAGPGYLDVSVADRPVAGQTLNPQV